MKTSKPGFLVLLFLLMVCLPAAAGPVGFGWGGGLYDALAPSGNTGDNEVALLFNARVEVFGAALVDLGAPFGAAVEGGVAVTPLLGDPSLPGYSFIEFPVRVAGLIGLESVTFEPYLGGLIMLNLTGSVGAGLGLVTTINFEAGCRVMFGSASGLYLEAGFVPSARSFVRFGAGVYLYPFYL